MLLTDWRCECCTCWTQSLLWLIDRVLGRWAVFQHFERLEPDARHANSLVIIISALLLTKIKKCIKARREVIDLFEWSASKRFWPSRLRTKTSYTSNLSGSSQTFLSIAVVIAAKSSKKYLDRVRWHFRSCAKSFPKFSNSIRKPCQCHLTATPLIPLGFLAKGTTWYWLWMWVRTCTTTITRLKA